MHAEANNVLLAADLDHFKAINDKHGHALGDRVLQGAVAVLNARKRPSDQLFRTGGEEFVLLLSRITPTGAARLAEALCRLMSQAPLLSGERVTIGIGVAPQPAALDASAWLRAADGATYAAKQAGRNQVVVAPG